VTTAHVHSQSVLKIGSNLNTDFVGHKLGMMVYPSFEINYERILSRKFSLSLGYNYAVKDYGTQFYEAPVSLYSFTYHWMDYVHTIIPEARYYFESSRDGVFIQAGLPFTYTVTKHSNLSMGGSENYSEYLNALTCFVGLGLKHQFNPHWGVEFFINISPSADLLGEVDYGASGFFKSGIKMFYNFDRIKTDAKK